MTITDLLVNLDCILWLLLFFLVLHRASGTGNSASCMRN